MSSRRFMFMSGLVDALSAQHSDRRFMVVGTNPHAQLDAVSRDLRALITPDVHPQPAEACTEIGADPVMPRDELYALEGPFSRYPRLTIGVLCAAIAALLCWVPADPRTEDEFELVADQLAASEVQP